MKPKLTDYLIILMALSAIFLCGYGVGHLVGGKSAREQQTAVTLPAPDGKNNSNWEKRMFERLDTLLEFTPAQQENVRREVARTSTEIRSSRDKAMKDYYLHLLILHQRLPAHLNDGQNNKIEKITKSLQENLPLRFPEKESP